MSIRDDMIEQDMIDRDICFICHEQNNDCECNNPETYYDFRECEPESSTIRMATLSIPHDNC